MRRILTRNLSQASCSCYNLGESCGYFFMVHPNVKFLRGMSMMLGGIVGVGVFGLPFAFAQSGLAIGLLELLFVGGLLCILQLMFAEVVIQTPGHHRTIYYIENCLGRLWKPVAAIVLSLSMWGAMLAYMIVGGEFVSMLFSPLIEIPASFFSYALAIVIACFVWGGLKAAVRIEWFIMVSLLFLFVFVILASLPEMHLANFFTFDSARAFVPYGVILFALSGIGIVPEMKDVFGNQHKRLLSHAIVISMSIIIVLYALFAIAVVGVTGADTTPVAFYGLVSIFGNSFLVVATVLGSLTVASIYMILGIELLNTFKFDFHLRHTTAWLLVCIVPIIFFALGLREFIEIIGFVGSVLGGTLAILIAVSYWKMKTKMKCADHHCINFPAPFTWLLVGLFSIGIIMEIISLLKHII